MSEQTPPQTAPPAGAPPVRSREEIQADVVAALKTVYDPEIPVDIYELGLVYGLDVDDEGNVSIRLTLTSPMCPVAGSLPPEVEAKVATVPGVKAAAVEVVWDPPWNPSMMSEAARLELGFD
jgi:FeS assembly SUF system protein